MTRKTLIAITILAAGIVLLFKDVLAKLVYDWGTDENYSHGFIVVPLAGYVAWRLRPHVSSVPVSPSPVGLLLVAVSVLTLIAGMLGAELFLTRAALLGTLAGSVLFIWGADHLKALRFPFLLLFLAVPIPAMVFNQITFPLQLLASRFGEFTIAACGIPVLREGNVITLATTSLEVVEACSGIRSLVSLVTLAVIWGYFTQSPTWLRWALALSSVPIAIFANGIRVAGTGVAAHFIGPRAAEGFLHTFSGWMLFVVAGALMLGVHRLGKRLGPAGASRLYVKGQGSEAIEPSPERRRGDGQFLRRSLLVSALLVVAAFALDSVTHTEAKGLRQPLSTLPLEIGTWRGRDLAAFDSRILQELAVDEYVTRIYATEKERWLSLYVGYYRSQRQGQTIHSPLNCLPGAGWQPVDRGRMALSAPAVTGTLSNPPEINRLIIQKGLDRQLVLYWYQAHGRIVASEYWGKIYTVVDAIRSNRSDAALVRVVVPIDSQDPAAEQEAERAGMDFVGRLLPVLTLHLDG